MKEMIQQYLSLPKITYTDIIEILIISFLIYEVMVFIKNTRAWMLFKGILVIMGFVLIASLFHLSTILWIADKTLSVGIIAVIVVFQPELRKALESLGRRNPISNIFADDGKGDGGFTGETIYEMVKGVYALAKTKTGALIVIEKNILLTEYENTGIPMDSLISSQLLVNIFEHNTPLHDGAIVVRGNRILAATCYLPLSDNMELSKELGTRHRAGVGVSEVTDSLVVIVSEETGKVSVAEGGRLSRDLNGDQLRKRLESLQDKPEETVRHKLLWKGRRKAGEK